ncbi:GreA/GreB family elongation factor [Thermacetogenium phaeum]|jgi:hypothetical protein|uniref:GreA/GreB family elongation factor n=1 Tax=Thermacetogenium phaeum TaxID=85874 RepID=UPI00191C203F
MGLKKGGRSVCLGNSGFPDRLSKTWSGIWWRSRRGKTGSFRNTSRNRLQNATNLQSCSINIYLSTAENGDISYLSPVGKSLLMRKPGEKVMVKAPGGTFCYKIKSIKRPRR